MHLCQQPRSTERSFAKLETYLPKKSSPSGWFLVGHKILCNALLKYTLDTTFQTSNCSCFYRLYNVFRKEVGHTDCRPTWRVSSSGRSNTYISGHRKWSCICNNSSNLSHKRNYLPTVFWGVLLLDKQKI